MRTKMRAAGIVLLIISFLGLCLVADYYIFTKLNEGRLSLANNFINNAEKEPDKAKKLLLLEQGTLLNPTEQNNLTTGTTAVELGDNELASHYLSGVHSAAGLLKLGDAYYAIKLYDKAATSYQASWDKEKTQAAAVGLANSYLKQGDLGAAKSFVGNAAGDSSWQQLVRLNLLLNSGTAQGVKEPQIVAILNEKLASNKSNLIYNELNKLGFPQAAQKYLVEQASISMLDRNGYIELGNAYFSNGDYGKAKDNYLKALALDPYYPQVYKHLYEVELKLGDSASANQYNEYYKKITW